MGKIPLYMKKNNVEQKRKRLDVRRMAKFAPSWRQTQTRRPIASSALVPPVRRNAFLTSILLASDKQMFLNLGRGFFPS
ncbi:hypothetical protein J14TS2_31840 [Bacillus sp. J14TS2]|nr:hypothetical protein J14TS2_31840 [Bacillus sp. J14TS2]